MLKFQQILFFVLPETGANYNFKVAQNFCYVSGRGGCQQNLLSRFGHHKVCNQYNYLNLSTEASVISR